MLRSFGRYLGRHHLALLALFVALGGTSYAAVKLPRNSVGTPQLKNGAVTKKKISKATIRGLKGQRGPKGDTGPSTGAAGGDLTGSYPNPGIAAGAVTGAKVANDSLGGAQINEANLQYSTAGCQLGLVHSFARIHGAAGIPPTYSQNSAYRDLVWNCGGGTTEVRRASAGHYFLRFNGDPAALALAVNNGDAGCTVGGTADIVTVGKVTSGGGDAGAYEIFTYVPGGGFFDACVTVLTF